MLETLSRRYGKGKWQGDQSGYVGCNQIVERRNEMRQDILDAIKDLEIDCPDCQGIGDEQYTCTTCWCGGGDGTINAYKYLMEKSGETALSSRLAEAEGVMAELGERMKNKRDAENSHPTEEQPWWSMWTLGDNYALNAYETYKSKHGQVVGT